MARRRLLMGKKSRLPAAYQEVEWLENGTIQYINVGLKPSEDLRTKIVQAYTGQRIATNSSIFGSKGSGNTRYWVNYDQHFEYGYGAYGTTNVATQINTVNTIDFNYIKEGKHYSNFNGNEYSFVGVPNTTEDIVLFGRNATGSIIIAQQKIYMAQFIRNNVLTACFVPCYRKSDNKPGMYDLCGSICPLTNSPFYINAGTGEFEVGPDVN